MTKTGIRYPRSSKRSPRLWLMLMEFLNPEFEEYPRRGPKAIAHLYAFARMTNGTVSAVLLSDRDQVYELFFGFSSFEDQRRCFLDMVHGHALTDCPGDEILIPEEEEIGAAKPIADVLPAPVMREAIITHAMLMPVHGMLN